MEAHPEVRADAMSPADIRLVEEIVTAMAAAIPADKAINSQIVLAAIGSLCANTFLNLAKPEYAVRIWEDFAYHTRQQLIEAVKEMRRDGH